MLYLTISIFYSFNTQLKQTLLFSFSQNLSLGGVSVHITISVTSLFLWKNKIKIFV